MQFDILEVQTPIPQYTFFIKKLKNNKFTTYNNSRLN